MFGTHTQAWMHCVDYSQLGVTERLNWRNHHLVHWWEKNLHDFNNISCYLVRLKKLHCRLTFHLTQQNGLQILWRRVGVEARWVQIPEPGSACWLPPGDMKCSQNTNIVQHYQKNIKTMFWFTSERLRSPKSLQRSQSVLSPTSRMTNRPTNFTPSAPARLTPVSTSHSHQVVEKGLKTK